MYKFSIFLIPMFLLQFSLSSLAQPAANPENQPQNEAQTETPSLPIKAEAIRVADVDELLKKRKSLNNKRLVLSGPVVQRIDDRSFILESCSGKDRDRVVVALQTTPGNKNNLTLSEGQNVQVTGTYRNVPYKDFRKEMMWNVDPKLEPEFRKMKNFIIAENIAKL